MASLTPSDNGENNDPPRICQVEEAADSESRPRATPREEKKEKGGYECEFVEPPPKQLQSECSICLLVLRDPHIVSCCGNNFCETCIGRIQRDGKPCPLCNEPGFTTMANKGLKRALNEFQVRCPHRELGCEWVGELGKFDQHLNANPQPERQLEGCPLTSVECIHCKDHMRRHVIAGHQNERCPKRPYTCEYCEEYESTFEDVANHWAECKCYLLPCPNNCHPSGSGIKRQNVEHHVKEECPLTVVECDFHYAGCRVKLHRKDTASHMKQESMAHISLLAAENQRLAKQLLERDEKMQQLQESMQQLTQMNTELSNRIDQQQKAKQELQQGLSRTKDTLQQQQDTHQELAERTDQQLQKAKQELQQGLSQTKDALQQQQDTHQELAERTDQQLQKASQELQKELMKQNTALSVRIDQQHSTHCVLDQQQKELQKELTQMKDTLHQLQQQAHGEKTNQQQKVNQELRKELAQVREALHRTQQELAEKVTRTTDQQQKVKQELKKAKETQQQQQRQHRELASKIAVQLQELQKMEELRQRSQTVPTIIKMAGFKELKANNTDWFSSPFYTHIGGYKMCLRVGANGCINAIGTHVSLYTCLMCGEVDSTLKWPFRGEITIQLLNQLEDRQNHTVTINYTDKTPHDAAGPVTTEKRATAYGHNHKFIPHSQLNFNRAKNCQYLKDDCIIFRVLLVKLQ